MGVGDSWGTREELLHPRDSKGRFRSAWKMSKAAVERTSAVLAGFAPKTWATDAEAGADISRLAKPGKKLPLDDFAKIQTDLRAGKTTPAITAMKAAEVTTTEDMIVSSNVGPEAFGLDASSIALLEEYTGKLVADKGFRAGNVGTPLPRAAGTITLVTAVPKGTKVIAPGGGSREVILTDLQPLRITKVDSDGQGGFYIMATAMPKGSVGNVRTKKLGTYKPTSTDPDGDGVPGVAPSPGVDAPGAPQSEGPNVAGPQAQAPPKDPSAPKGAPRNEPIVTKSVRDADGDGIPDSEETDATAKPSPDAAKSTPQEAASSPAPVDPAVSKEVRDKAAEILADRVAGSGVAKKASARKVQGRKVTEPAGKPIPDSVRVDLSTASMGELRQIAKDEGIKIPSSVRRKDEIQRVIRNARGSKGVTVKRAAPPAVKKTAPAPAKKPPAAVKNGDMEDRVAVLLLDRMAPGVRDKIMKDMTPEERREVQAARDRVKGNAPAKKVTPTSARKTSAPPAKAPAKKAATPVATKKVLDKPTDDTLVALRQQAKNLGVTIPASLTSKDEIAAHIKKQQNKPPSLPVPTVAEPFNITTEGIEDLVARVNGPKTGVTATDFSGGAVGRVSRLEYPDGVKVFRKTNGSILDISPKTSTDAEQLVGRVGEILGANTPRVYRERSNRIYTDWVDGRVLDQFLMEAGMDFFGSINFKLGKPSSNERVNNMIQSKQAKRLALLDVITANKDRHGANILVDKKGNLVGIDHGFSYDLVQRGRDGDLEFKYNSSMSDADFRDFMMKNVKESPFVNHHLASQGKEKKLRDDLDFITKDDINEIRRRLEALRPQYAKLNRTSWLDYSLRVLDELGKRATGKESLLDD